MNTTVQPPETGAVEHEIGSAGECSIHVLDEDVELRGVEGGVVRVREPRGATAASLEIERGASRFALRIRRKDRDHRVDRLVIEVPTGATMAVESKSGDVRAEGLVGEQRYRSVSGDVTLHAAGGQLGIEAVSGDIDVAAVASSEVAVRTVSGDVAIDGTTIGRLRVATTSGDLVVRADLVAPGPHSIETVSGDASLAVDGDVRVEPRTLTGDVRSELAGRTGPTLTFRSMSGDLHVTRGSSAPPRPTAALDADALTTRVPVDPAPAVTPPPADDPRLEVLLALERGDIDVAEAGRRLAALDAGDGPHDG